MAQKLPVDARLGAHDETVGVGERGGERFGLPDARNDFDPALAQYGEAALCKWFGDDDAGLGEAGPIGRANHELSTMRERFDAPCALKGWLASAGPAFLTP